MCIFGDSHSFRIPLTKLITREQRCAKFPLCKHCMFSLIYTAGAMKICVLIPEFKMISFANLLNSVGRRGLK